MAVHNEQSLRSFSSFYEEDNFDDDDDDHNFIISLDSSGDEDGRKSNNVASFHTSVSKESYLPHVVTPRQEVSVPVTIPCHFDNGNTYNPPNFTYSSNVSEKITYNVEAASHVRNITQANSNLQSNIFSTSSENQKTSYQFVPTDHVIPGPIYNPESNLWPETSYQEKTFVSTSCSSGSSGTTFSVKFAPAPNFTVSETVSSQFMHSRDQNCELPDKNGFQQKHLQSPAQLSKTQLETIHFDQEAGGMWSEAVFLSPTEMSDSSFSGIVNYPRVKTYPEKAKCDSPLNSACQFTTSNVSSSSPQIVSGVSYSSYIPPSLSQVSSNVFYSPGCVPKLHGPYSKKSDPGTSTEHHFDTRSYTVQNVCENVSKVQTLVKNALCTCIMCYKGRGIIEWYPEYEDAVLTAEEEQLILQGPAKRKRQRRSVGESKRKKSSSSPCLLELDCQTISSLSDTCPVKTQSTKSSLVTTVAPALQAQQHGHILYKQGNFQPIQPKPLSISSKTQENPLPDLLSRHKSSTNPVSHENITPDASAGTKKPHMKCETPKTTAAPSLTSMILLSPNPPNPVSVPRFRSNPAKVFLKPTEVPGQRFQIVSGELNLSKNLSLSTTGKESLVQSPVTLKESPKTSLSPSTTLSSPPSYKIIYVSQDQVLVCPSQTKTSVNSMPLTSQVSTAKSNFQNVTLIKMPQSSIQSKTSSDSRPRMHLPTVVSQNSQLYMNKSPSITHPSSLICTNTFDTPQQLQQVLKNAEKVDISTPGKVIIKLKSPPKISSSNKGNLKNSQSVTNVGAVSNIVTPVSKSSVCMTSILKDFKSPQVRGIESNAGVNWSQSCSVSTSSPSHTTSTIPLPVVAKPSSMEVAQTLMSLIKSHLHEEKTKEKVLVNLLKGSLQTEPKNMSHKTQLPLKDTHQNIEVAGITQNKHQAMNIQVAEITPSKHQTMTYKPTKDDQALISILSGRKKSVEYRINGNCEKVTSPHLPQEGLPSTYIQDWVNQTKTYESEHIPETEPENLNPPVSGANTTNNHTVCASLLNDHASQINNDPHSSAIEAHSRIETLYPTNLTSQSQEPSASAASVQEIQVFPKPTSESSNVPNTTNISAKMSHVHTRRPVDLSSTSNMAEEQIPQSCSLQGLLQTTSATSKDTSYHKEVEKDYSKQEVFHISRQSDNKSPVLPELCKTRDSSVIDNTKGIKLKIKLSELRKESWKHKRSRSAMETSARNVCVEAPHHGSENEFSLSKRNCPKSQEERTDDTAEVINNPKDGNDKMETAEEMFQRFQKQAEQEVFKAQMGMGYLSRSLRPSRTTMAFINKFPYKFGSGKSKKKTTNEEHLQIVSKKITDEMNMDAHEIEPQTGKSNAHIKKSKIPNKRQVEESGSIEVRVKQPKLSMKDYPRFSQDCSITDCRNLFCSDILAGHKVFVKFNTYENVCSGRVFLIPFFNLGGTRTQFDVEDMEYINKAVLEFEREERSCARHLLFYAREGQKATFLRKETHFQTNQIVEKNYRKCSFILEGFKRETKKQTETPPEEWKVDNTIDIEIDRAEVDNDAEIEFDIDMEADEVTGKLGNYEIEHEEDTDHLLEQNVPNGTEENQEPCECRPLLPCHSTKAAVSARAIVSKEPVCLQSVYSKQSSRLNTDNSVHIRNVQTAEFEVSKIHSVNDSFSNSQNGLGTPSLALKLKDTTTGPIKTSAYTERLQEFISDLHYESNDGTGEAHVPCKNSTVLQKEIMPNNSEIHASFSVEVKQEQLDDDYESNITSFYHPLTAGNINSKNFSSTPDHNEQNFVDKLSICIKKEPVDEYLDSSLINNQEEPNAQIENFQNVNILPCSQDTISPKLSIVQHNSPEKEVGTSSSIVGVLDQQLENTVVSSPTLHQHILEDQIAESGMVLVDNLSSRPQTAVESAETDPADTKNCNLEPSLSSTGTISDSVDNTGSIKSSSNTEASLPESPLPSSFVSESSDLSASSDIDDEHVSSGSICSALSYTSLPVQEFITEDGNTGNQQSRVQSKITSLVESLRNRLTQNTSSLPPWLASADTSVNYAQVKKKKKLKRSVDKEKSQDAILPSETPAEKSQDDLWEIPTSDTISKVAAEANICPQAIPSQSVSSCFSTTMIIGSEDSLSVAPLCGLPAAQGSSPSKCNLSLPSICTSPCPVNVLESPVISNNAFNLSSPVEQIILNRGPMLLPKKQLVSLMDQPSDSRMSNTKSCDLPPIATNTSHEDDPNMPNKESDETQNKALSEKALSIKSTLCFGNRYNSSDQHIETVSDNGCLAYSESVDSGKQSPIDFEIEVGEEDHPETALNLQPILPNEPIDIEALKLNRGKHMADYEDGDYLQHLNEEPSFFRLGKYKRRLSHEKKQSHLNNKHFNDSEISTESEKHTSVADYLSQKFLFSGASHKIQGPRLLHMPANRRTGSKESNKHKLQAPNTSTSSVLSEPITTAELSTTPSVVEIFGASLGNNTANTKVESSDPGNTSGPPKISMKEKIESTGSCRAQVSKKRTWNRKARKSSTLKARFGKSKTATAAAATGNPVCPQHQPAQGVKTSNLLSKMKPCKVVLTKLDMAKFHKLSDNVFIITKDFTDIKDTLQPNKTEKNSGNSHNNNNHITELRKIIGKKRKKGSRMLKKPVLKPKRDIVDYYAQMLVSLQKKAQQLEEESKRKVEENANKEMCKTNEQKKNKDRKLSITEKTDGEREKLSEYNILEETKPKDSVQEHGIRNTDGDFPLQAAKIEKVTMSSEVENSVDPLIITNDKDGQTVYDESFTGCQITADYQNSNISGLENSPKEIPEAVVQNRVSDDVSKEESDIVTQNGHHHFASKEIHETVVQNGVDVASKEILETVVQNGVDVASKEKLDTIIQNGVDVASKEKLNTMIQNRGNIAFKEIPEAVVQNGVDFASKEAIVDSGVSDVCDSNWPYLQKFCDETIFHQASTDYMQKLSGGVIFSKLNTASVSEVSFEKKDVVLGGSVDDEGGHGGPQDITHTLHEAEDTDCCLEGCSDELDRGHVEEDDMLLGLDIQKAAFSLDDHEDTEDHGTEDVAASSHTEGLAVYEITQRNSSYNENAAHEIYSSASLLEHSSCPEPRDSKASTAPVNPALVSCTSSPQPVPLQTATGRSGVHVSPSWERLLGQKSLDVNEQLALEQLPSHFKEPNKHKVSLAASSNFKCKFKLPRGLLSNAVKLSRDMGKMLEGSEESSLGQPGGSVDQAVEKNSDPQNCISGLQNIDHPAQAEAGTTENTNVSLTSQKSLPLLKFSPGTLTAIQKAKAEFVQRKQGPQSKRGLKQSKNEPMESDLLPVQDTNTIVGTADSVKPSASEGDSGQTVQPGNARSSHRLTELSGLTVENGGVYEGNMPSGSKQCPSDTTELKKAGWESDIQSILHAGKTVTETGQSNVCLKQSRKDGIFSNIDIFHGLDECTTKVPSEPPPNKEARVKEILKNSTIDINKLKLKLTPLFANKVKERTAHTSEESRKHHSLSQTVKKDDVLVCENVQNSLESEEPEVKSPGGNSTDGVKASECVSDKLDTPSSEPQPVSSFICKPTPQVNAAKLCNILKNFQKKALITSTATKGVSELNNADKNTSSLSPMREKTQMMETLAETSALRKKTKGRAKKQKVAVVNDTNEGKGKRVVRKAKEKANGKMLTASSVNVALPVTTAQEESIYASDRSKTEDKGERSFFDCLSTVPLDAWEEKSS